MVELQRLSKSIWSRSTYTGTAESADIFWTSGNSRENKWTQTINQEYSGQNTQSETVISGYRQNFEQFKEKRPQKDTRASCWKWNWTPETLHAFLTNARREMHCLSAPIDYWWDLKIGKVKVLEHIFTEVHGTWCVTPRWRTTNHLIGRSSDNRSRKTLFSTFPTRTMTMEKRKLRHSYAFGFVNGWFGDHRVLIHTNFSHAPWQKRPINEGDVTQWKKGCCLWRVVAMGGVFLRY